MGEITAFWAQLDENERATVRAVGVFRDFALGETLLMEDDASRHVGILWYGRARVIRFGTAPRPTLLAIRGPGDIVGEMAAFTDGQRSSSVIATDHVRALMVSRRALDTLIERNPRLLYVLLNIVIQRLRDADRRRALQTSGLLSRIASVIGEIADDYGRVVNGATVIEIISQEDLASMVGTSRESLCRELRILRDDGIVSTARGRITIIDRKVLRTLEGNVH